MKDLREIKCPLCDTPMELDWMEIPQNEELQRHPFSRGSFAVVVETVNKIAMECYKCNAKLQFDDSNKSVYISYSKKDEDIVKENQRYGVSVAEDKENTIKHFENKLIHGIDK